MARVKDWFPQACSTEQIMNRLSSNPKIEELIHVIYTIYCESRGKIRWGDKTPRNLQCLGKIVELFPDAKIIIIMRDCRDVVLSMQKVDFGGLSIYSSAKRWKTDAQHTKEALEKYPDQTYFVKYEDLLNHPIEVCSKLFKFIGENQEINILEKYITHEDDVGHSKSELYKKPVMPKNAFKWKIEMSKEDIATCERVAGSELIAFGYNLVSKETSQQKLYCFSSEIRDLLKRCTNRTYMENHFSFLKIITKRCFLYPFGH